jgi:hypothetical protein
MSVLADARAALYGALAHIFDDPVPVLGGDPIQFSAGRAQEYPPQDFVAPVVWIEQPRGSTRQIGATGATTIDYATFPVAVVYDGADRAQVAGLDELVARVWDAARTVGEPFSFQPQPIDAGGPSLRATFVDVDMPIAALTFCGTEALIEEVA